MHICSPHQPHTCFLCGQHTKKYRPTTTVIHHVYFEQSDFAYPIMQKKKKKKIPKFGQQQGQRREWKRDKEDS